MKPYVVLGVYKPKLWKAWKIGRDLTAFTRSMGITPLPVGTHQQNEKAAWHRPALHAEVRKTAKAGSQGTGWHQDGDMSGAMMDCGLVLWSNTTPTEFKDKEGKVWQPKPFEIVYAENLACYHRRPSNAPTKRWSFRQRVKK